MFKKIPFVVFLLRPFFAFFYGPLRNSSKSKNSCCFLRTLWPLAYYNFLRPTLNCSCSVFKYLSFFTQCVFSESAFLVFYSKTRLLVRELPKGPLTTWRKNKMVAFLSLWHLSRRVKSSTLFYMTRTRFFLWLLSFLALFVNGALLKNTYVRSTKRLKSIYLKPPALEIGNIFCFAGVTPLKSTCLF